MASSAAWSASAGVRRGPPMAATASQKAPAPSPSSTRPPVGTSRVAADLASIAGGRRGRLATSGKNRMRVVCPASQAIRVHVSWNRHW
jgi:hypothetical protein